ncbi:MAG TPA: hypothetical protein VFM25_08380 [Verrucomicrobiae bacterium]|nr:hypothetical protein [Verrucomicrobiae bacterium]
MGRSYLFECPKCGYHATVSGGADHGNHLVVQTIACRDCRKLFDAVVKLKLPKNHDRRAVPGFSKLAKRPLDVAPPFEKVVNRLPLAPEKYLKWTPVKLRCPISPYHRIQPWNNPGKCPRCGVFLDKAPTPFRMWE